MHTSTTTDFMVQPRISYYNRQFHTEPRVFSRFIPRQRFQLASDLKSCCTAVVAPFQREGNSTNRQREVNSTNRETSVLLPYSSGTTSGTTPSSTPRTTPSSTPRTHPYYNRNICTIARAFFCASKNPQPTRNPFRMASCVRTARGAR